MSKLSLLLFAASILAVSMSCCAVINDQLDPKADEPNTNATLVEGTMAPAWKVKLEERQNAAKLRREELLKAAKKRREERLEKRKKFQEDYAKWLRLSPERKREELKKWLERRRKERKEKAEERQRKIRAQIEAAKNRRNGVTTPQPEVVVANATANPTEEVANASVSSENATGGNNSATTLGASSTVVDAVGNGTEAVGNTDSGTSVGNNENVGNGTEAVGTENAGNSTVGDADENLVNAMERAENAEGNATAAAGGCPCPTAENQALKQGDPPASADTNQGGSNSQQQVDGQQKAETVQANQQSQQQDAREEQQMGDSDQANNSELANAENDAVQVENNAESSTPSNLNSAVVKNEPSQPNTAAAPVVVDSVKVGQKKEKAKKENEQKKDATRVPTIVGKKDGKSKGNKKN